MRTSDIFLFGGPILLGVFGWTVVWFSRRSDRIHRQRARQGAAE